MSDTWGIPGPTFLWLFLAASAITVIASLIHRARVFAGPAQVSVDHLHPQQLAYLNGGRQLAVYSSLTWLRQQQLVETGETGKLNRLGGVPAGATALDAAVLHAAGSGLRASQLTTERSVAAALDALQEELRRAGLALEPDAQRRARTGAKVLAALFLLGLFRVFAGVSNNRPVFLLVLALVPVFVITLVLWLRMPVRTRAATRALAEARAKYAHLRPSQQPSWQTYGATNTAMAVGLYGATVLWVADPEFAQHAGISQQQAAMGSTAGFGGSSWSSGDSGGGSSGGDSGGGGGGGCGG